VRTSVIRSSVGRSTLHPHPALLILAWRCSGPAELRHEPMTLEKMSERSKRLCSMGGPAFQKVAIGFSRIEGLHLRPSKAWVQVGSNPR